MLDMYADYIKEKRGLGTIKSDYGFVTYLINGAEFFIEDFYVRPEFRKKGKAHELANEVYKLTDKYACEYITANISLGSNNATETLMFHLAMGQCLHSANQNIITTIQTLGESNG